MISCSSSLASSTPATSLNVTFFCVGVSSLALDLPKDSALLPPACIWRMKKNQIATSRINGPVHHERRDEGGILLRRDSISTFLARRSLIMSG